MYVLVAPRQERIYIGVGDPVYERLAEHDEKKDFWTRAIVFTYPNLTKSHFQYFESHLVKLARESGQCELDNANSPNVPTLSEIPRLEKILREIRKCLSAIGVEIFDEEQRSFWFLESGGVQATAYESGKGFIVRAGSQAVVRETGSLDARVKERRASLLADGILKEENGVYVFTEDCPLNSPSFASNVVQGASSDGLRLWQNESGVSLKTLRERESRT